MRRTPLLWIGGGLVVIVASTAVITHLVSRPIPFRRYVSPPLHDGTRYTFLYPAGMVGPSGGISLTMAGPGGRPFKAFQVTAYTPPSPFTRLISWSPWVWRTFQPLILPHGSDQEQVELFETDDPATARYLTLPFLPTVSSRQGPYRRIETDYVDGENDEHNIILTKDGSGVICRLTHEYTGHGRHTSADFDRDDTMIVASFQALPPGTPVPSP